MRFAKPRKTSHQETPEPVEWTDVAVSNQRWSEALKDPETAFKMWASNADEWLVKSRVLQEHHPEKTLAESPKLLSGAHRMGTLQSLDERQIRRLLRRLQEAHFLQLQLRTTSPHTPTQQVDLHWCCPSSWAWCHQTRGVGTGDQTRYWAFTSDSDQRQKPKSFWVEEIRAYHPWGMQVGTTRISQAHGHWSWWWQCRHFPGSSCGVSLAGLGRHFRL